MIKIPFSRNTKGEDGDKASVVFTGYCREELERRRDYGEGFDEERFNVAVDLAVDRLRAMEAGEDKA